MKTHAGLDSLAFAGLAYDKLSDPDWPGVNRSGWGRDSRSRRDRVGRKLGLCTGGPRASIQLRRCARTEARRIA